METKAPTRAADAPLSARCGLLANLARDVSLLLRQEIALARSQILGKFGELRTGGGLLGAMAAAVMGLARVLPSARTRRRRARLRSHSGSACPR